ncbi:YecA family protein [Undibacterium umbellatum]|uniref:Preprotein translocase subunit SecA n=1 Tax=Undibacterium umbellatum TaxID=2762300 RepID=A0ABR6ZGR5_9BURK|nr:SEC-C metal-binding domain-containing protein [Undibacterium umbellatum]MBC3910924.1 preprotein translocase subunit SecA [Undibacterium umbellatum]
MKKRNNSNKAKKKKVAPDEFFEHGPISMARFGNLTVGQSNWQPDQFKDYHKRLAEAYPRIVSEIDLLIAEAMTVIAASEPLSLLHRAWGERTVAHMDITSEIEIKAEHVHKQRMIDYVQSLIAATPPDENQKEMDEETWQRLDQAVTSIFEKLNPWFFISESAHRRTTLPEVSEAAEEFRFRAQIMWCNVSGVGYQAHSIPALRELLIPQSKNIEKAYGLDGNQLCNELAKVWHSLTMGFGEAIQAMDEFRHESLDALEDDIQAGIASEGTLAEQMDRTVLKHGLAEKRDAVFGKFFGLDLFDLQKVTNLPSELLNDFSWSPGQETDFLSEGNFKGWPLRIWPTFKRPFLKVGSNYYCFDQTTLFDHFFRQIEKRVYQLAEAAKQSWIATRKEVTERLPFEYLARILPRATILQEVYYSFAEGGKKAKTCETDGILIYDDHLFVIEIKAGAFTYTDPTTDFDAHVKSLKALLADPAKQGSRFLKYLRGAKEVPLFNRDGNEIFRIRNGDYRQVTLCAITLDQFTEIAAQAQRVSKIGVEVGTEPLWALSLGDLRVYADIFTNPLEFLHFVEQRKEAFASSNVQLDDELDHLGLYLKHNHYVKHLEDAMQGPKARIQALGYRQKIDEFYSARLGDPAAISPLRQDMPPLMATLLDLLALSSKPGRSEIAAYILDLGGHWRTDIFDYVQQEIERIPDSRPRPFSTHGNVRLTVVPWSERWGTTASNEFQKHVKAIMLLHGETDRHLLELAFDFDGKLNTADWKVIRQSDISFIERPKLVEMAELLREKRLKNVAATGKHVGRNEQCPCGSGKKFKKCCIERAT